MMTEKRFTLAYSDDTEKSKWWAVRDGDITLWKEEVVYLLNQLHEENEQLLKENKRLYEDNIRVKQLITEAYETERTELGRSTLKNLLLNLGVDDI